VGGAEVAQTQARRCELHFANRGQSGADVRNQYVPPISRLHDHRARELCHLMRGHDVFDSLDEICQQRYRHLVRRMDRLPA
jgi:hypothetical protein